jgi:alcohol dehydrogenase class IV
VAKLKIQYPSLAQPREVICGTGSLRVLAELDALPETVIFLSGTSKVRDRVAARFAKRDIALADLRTLEKPPGEPQVDMIRDAAARLRDSPTKRIVAIGGGSVLDWARLAWAESEGLLAGRQLQGFRREAPELWLVPTTCATGAEATGVAVFREKDALTPVVASAFVADRVVLDGSFLEAADPSRISLWCCDASSHAIEAWLSIVPNRLAKDAAASALAAILEAHPATPGASRNERLMEAAYWGGIAVGGCSAGVIHAFAHSVAQDGVPHAAGNALGLVAGLAANAEAPALGALLRRIGLDSVDSLIASLRRIVLEGLAGFDACRVLAQLGDTSSRQRIAERMANDSCMRSNPIRIEPDALEAFFERICETAEAP